MKIRLLKILAASITIIILVVFTVPCLIYLSYLDLKLWFINVKKENRMLNNKSSKAQGAVEYALLLVMMAVVVIAVLLVLGNQLPVWRALAMLGDTLIVDDKATVVAENKPDNIVPPMPNNPEFNAGLSELQYRFVIWSMRQPWAKELKWAAIQVPEGDENGIL